MSNDIFGYNEKLPEDIREMFMWLCQDVALLQHKWIFYLELFSSQENTTLLSELALASFNIIEESLRSDMTMSICRLSDPPQTGKKDNLSLNALVQHCSTIDDIDKLLENFLKACKPIRQHRNKRVGHNDLNTTIKPRDNPLPGIGRKQIDRILKLASDILNVIYQDFVDSELNFKPLHIGGADALIYWLKEARQYEAEKRQTLNKLGREHRPNPSANRT